MSSEDLTWVGSLGQRIGVAEDALRLIIGMILGKCYDNRQSWRTGVVGILHLNYLYDY